MDRFRRLFRLAGREPSPAEDVDAELEFHLQMKAEELERAGLGPDDARREARRAFGSRERFAAECRSIATSEVSLRRRRERLAGTLRELRLAARGLWRSPGYALSVALVLGGGVGLAATVVTLVHRVVVRPLPFSEPERLVRIYSTMLARGRERGTHSPADLLDLTREQRSFSAISGWVTWTSAAAGPEGGEVIRVVAATAGFLEVFAVRPVVGAGFTPEERIRGGPRALLLSYDLWRTRFGGDPAAVGKSWTLDGEPYRIAGVLPAGFGWPLGHRGVVVPFRMPENVATQRGARYIDVVGRLAPGVSRDQGESDLARIAAALEAEYPRWNQGYGVSVRPLQDEVVRGIRPTLLLLLGGVSLLALLSAANVANLVLVRAIRRRGELAVRGALGASRGWLMWHAVSEVALLALAGVLIAVPVGTAGIALVRRFGPGSVPRLDTVELDLVALAFLLGITVLMAIVSAGIPALRVARLDVRPLLSGHGKATIRGRRAQRWLMGAESAVAAALLASAGVLARSLDRLAGESPGFDPSSTLTFELNLAPRRYPDGDRIVGAQRELLARLRALPGVTAAGLTTLLPLAGGSFGSTFSIDGNPGPDDDSQSAQARVADAGYFAAARIPVVAGRGFGAEDRRGGGPVVLATESAVRRFWPDGRWVGREVRFHARPGDEPLRGAVVGVVGDLRDQYLGQEPRPLFFASSEHAAVADFTVVLRVDGNPAAIEPAVRRVIASFDSELAAASVRTMEEVVAASYAHVRFRTGLMGLFAAIAALLAGFGLYAVVAHAVAERSREIGLRRALGAGEGQVVREVVVLGMRDVAIGAVVGLAVAFLIGDASRQLLYEVKPADPLALATGTLLLVIVGVIACWGPARRAARVDPMESLRAE